MKDGSVFRRSCVACLALLLWYIPADPLRARQGQPAPAHAITWPEQRQAIEDWLREAPISRFEEVPIGVTRPKRAYFETAGPVRSAAWKPLVPGLYKGYWESYKSEIAAYELDKLLGLNMVPPTVERRIRGIRGAIIMWVEGVKGWDPNLTVAPSAPQEWSRQIIRMKMFDQLIGNIDRNQGNLLYDADFHIILIDHSRAFTSMTDMRKLSAPTRFDAWLWEKSRALTFADLQPALGKWIGKGEIEAILKRRDRMQLQLDELVRTRGEELAFIR